MRESRKRQGLNERERDRGERERRLDPDCERTTLLQSDCSKPTQLRGCVWRVCVEGMWRVCVEGVCELHQRKWERERWRRGLECNAA